MGGTEGSPHLFGLSKQGGSQEDGRGDHASIAGETDRYNKTLDNWKKG